MPQTIPTPPNVFTLPSSLTPPGGDNTGEVGSTLQRWADINAIEGRVGAVTLVDSTAQFPELAAPPAMPSGAMTIFAADTTVPNTLFVGIENGQALGNVDALPGSWRMSVLHENQLGGSGLVSYIRQAHIFWIFTQPSDGDTFVISDGTTTQTYEFESGGGVAPGNVAVTIGGTVQDTTTNIVTAINGTPGTVWNSVDGGDLHLHGVSDGSVIVYRITQNVGYADRIWAPGNTVLNTGAEWIDFTDGAGNPFGDYRKVISPQVFAEPLPTSDPGFRTFGMGRAVSQINCGDASVCILTSKVAVLNYRAGTPYGWKFLTPT